jgi:hypothetical protein
MPPKQAPTTMFRYHQSPIDLHCLKHDVTVLPRQKKGKKRGLKEANK